MMRITRVRLVLWQTLTCLNLRKARRPSTSTRDLLQGHFFYNMKLCHVLSNHISPILLRPTSTPLCIFYSQPLTLCLGVNTLFLHKFNPFQSYFPHLVRGRSHLLLDNLILNLIARSMPTHSPQRLHESFRRAILVYSSSLAPKCFVL